MRPVNLLPERDRAKGSAKAVDGSAFAVLGVLAVLLLAVAAYVLTTNQINGRGADVAKAQAEIEQAQANATTLGPFQRFAEIKEQRLSSVKSLAQARFDWERFMRELALVLPDGSSLTEVTASATGAPTAGAATGAAPVVADPAATGAPSVHVVGCAESQPTVAVVLVRLRQLHRATGVDLTTSSQQDEGAVAAAGSGDSASSSTGCGPGRYQFDATVNFDPVPPAEISDGQTVPSRLGGGS